MTHAPDRLANLLGALAGSLSAQIADATATVTAQGGGAPAALAQLAQHPGLSVDDLRRRLDLTHSAVVRLLDRLVDRGLVTRRRTGDDGRRTLLALTAAGEELARSVLAARARVLGAALGGLEAHERAALERILDRMLHALPTSADHSSQICRLCSLPDCPVERCPVEERYQDFVGRSD